MRREKIIELNVNSRDNNKCGDEANIKKFSQQFVINFHSILFFCLITSYTLDG
jgi:hypothetical protein